VVHKRVGVVTTTAARHHGGRSAREPRRHHRAGSAATLARLAAAGIDVKPARLVDLTIAGARYDTMKAARHPLAAPEFDLCSRWSARQRGRSRTRRCGQSSTARAREAAGGIPGAEAPERWRR
jgi:hypothetical protein